VILVEAGEKECRGKESSDEDRPQLKLNCVASVRCVGVRHRIENEHATQMQHFLVHQETNSCTPDFNHNIRSYITLRSDINGSLNRVSRRCTPYGQPRMVVQERGTSKNRDRRCPASEGTFKNRDRASREHPKTGTAAHR